MIPTRFLRFEIMEPRITLSANASELLAVLEADIAANGFDLQRAKEIKDQIAEAREDSPVTLPTAPPTNELSDTPVVRFRVDILDLQGQSVGSVQAGREYLAKIFVQDMRELTSADPVDSGNRGLYQVWVDLEFSENLHPAGSVRVNEAFSSQKIDPEFDGSFLRNLGGVASPANAFGGGEQFLLEAPFVVGSADTPSRIQVVASTSQPDPVLLFGAFGAVPNSNITSPALDLPSATNGNSRGSTSPPLIDPSDDFSVKLPLPTPPVISFPNSGDSFQDATSDDDFVALVSYIPIFREGDPDSHWKWRDENDWWRPNRRTNEKSHSDDRNELDWPEDDSKPLDAKSVSQDDSSSGDGMENDEEEENRGKRQSKHAGLFYDEALFLEGALVETFQSKFRLHLQVIGPQRQENAVAAESIANKHVAPQTDGFIDIAQILNSSQHTNPWQDNVDEAIAGHQVFPSPEYEGPAIDWGTIEPLPKNAAARRQDKQVEANQQLSDQRIPLAMSQSVINSPEAEMPPAVQ